MSELNIPPTEDPTVAAIDNSFERIIGIFTSPSRTFESIARRPDWFIPLLVMLLFAAATGFISSNQLDFEGTMREQLEGNKMNEEQREKAIEMGAGMQKVGPWLGVLFTPIILLILAAVMMLAHKIMGGAGGFGAYFSVAIYSWIPQFIKGILVTIILMAGEPMTINEMMVAAYTNPGFLADPSTNPVLFAFLTKLDVFTVWSLILMTIGYSIVSRGSRLRSAVIVVGLWACYVAISLIGPLMQAGQKD